MKYSTCTLAPAHMPKMSRGVAQRSLGGMKSTPCCSTWNASVRLRVVNDRQILCDCHRVCLPCVASLSAPLPESLRPESLTLLGAASRVK